MRKLFKIIFIFAILLFISILVFNLQSRIEKKKEVQQALNVLPEFNFLTLSGDNFSDKDLNSQLPSIFIYFNSGCDFCHHEAKEISEKSNLFDEVQILFISNENNKLIQEFAEKYRLLNLKNIVFLEDKHSIFSKDFDASSVPYTIIYDSKQRLIGKFVGQTSPEIMIKQLKLNKN